jgi:uncharacterized membrane protein YhaH (DUF805 family)
MSWGEIFFGFHGRINRRTYWLASILVSVAALSFAALLAYLVTGDPFAAEVWQRPADKSSLWMPVWLAYFLLLAWPSSALAIKRLHDRGRPAWIWYVYFAANMVLALMPQREAAGGQISPAAYLVLMPVAAFGLYVFFELGVLRGVPGANDHGEDTLPAGYYGGDYNFLSWMLAFEGRISRQKWWLGSLIVFGAFVGAVVAMAILLGMLFSMHPELQQKMNDPQWINTPEAKPFMFQLALWIAVPSLVMSLAVWSSFALGVKRLHDRGLSSWLILVVLLPLAGVMFAPAIAQTYGLGPSFVLFPTLLLLASAIWSVLQFGIFKGETGPNQHGPDPLAGRS